MRAFKTWPDCILVQGYSFRLAHKANTNFKGPELRYYDVVSNDFEQNFLFLNNKFINYKNDFTRKFGLFSMFSWVLHILECEVLFNLSFKNRIFQVKMIMWKSLIFRCVRNGDFSLAKVPRPNRFIFSSASLRCDRSSGGNDGKDASCLRNLFSQWFELSKTL